jgi:hypothetical protein
MDKMATEKRLSLQEFKALYMCDDGMGIMELLSSHLDVLTDTIRAVLEILIGLDLVYEEPNHTSWFLTTKRGKEYLKQYANSYEIDSKEL